MNTDNRRKMQSNEIIATNLALSDISFSGFLNFLIRVHLCASVVSNSVAFCP
jgi:hypothetical protein